MLELNLDESQAQDLVKGAELLIKHRLDQFVEAKTKYIYDSDSLPPIIASDNLIEAVKVCNDISSAYAVMVSEEQSKLEAKIERERGIAIPSKIREYSPLYYENSIVGKAGDVKVQMVMDEKVVAEQVSKQVNGCPI